HSAHPLEIGARTKGGSRAFEDNKPHAAVARHRVRPPGELRDHSFVERVAHLRPVQYQTLDWPVASDIEMLESHRYIRKTPKRGAAIGAFHAADNASASASRVSTGSRMPSSHNRAVE